MESNNRLEPRVMVQAQNHTPLHNHSQTTFEELAMPLFGPLYNFAHWTCTESRRRRGPGTGNICQSITRLRFFPAGDKL